MDENVCSHAYAVPKRHITLANFLSLGKFLQGRDRQKQISQASGFEKSSKFEFVFKSISYICVLVGIFIIFWALVRIGLCENAVFFLKQNHKCDCQNESCKNLIFSVQFS